MTEAKQINNFAVFLALIISAMEVKPGLKAKRR
jgi:hypothetical protein